MLTLVEAEGEDEEEEDEVRRKGGRKEAASPYISLFSFPLNFPPIPPTLPKRRRRRGRSGRSCGWW